MPSSFQQGSSSKTSIRGAGHQFSRSDAELADILARPRGEQTQVTNDGVRVFVDLSKHTIVNFVDLVAQQHAQRTLARKKEAKLAKKQQHAKRITEPESSDAMEVDPPEETGPESAVQSEAEGGDGEDVGESVGESDNSDNSDSNSEDSNDNDSDNPPPKKDFLDNLMDRFEKLYYVLDEEDEEERRAHEEGRPQKKRSRWDFESYDMNDDFIDDSEAMVQSMGIKLKPKESGFYVCRGPLVMVPVDEPSVPRKRGGAGTAGGGRRRAAAATATTTKGSNLALVESAIEWTPEVSEAERKPSGKSSNGEGGSAVPKKKRTTKAKNVTMADDADNDTNNDSDKQTKAPPKRAKAKATKNLTADAAFTQESPAVADTTTTSTPTSDSATSKNATTTTSKASTASKAKAAPASKATGSSPTTSAVTIPTVRVDSPPSIPMDGIEDSSTPQPPPSRPVSPLKVKSRSKAKASKAQQDGSLSADPATDDALTEDDTAQDSRAMDTSADHTALYASSKGTPPANAVDHESKSRSSSPTPRRASNSQGSTRDDGLDSEDQIVDLGPKPEEPLPEELRVAFQAIEEAADNELWESRGPLAIPVRTAMFTFGHQALEYCKGSGKIIPEIYFDHLRSIIPYNAITIRKVIYRILLPNWIKELEFEKTKMIGQFTQCTNRIWLASGLANQATVQDADGDVNLSGDEGRLQKKFPWSHDLRLLLWETMEMFMEIRQAKHELHLVKASFPAPPTDSKTRKDAYQTLLLSFPSGWTTSYEISRQYSQLKEKVQKQKNDKKEVGVTKPVLPTKTKAAAASAASRPSKAASSPSGPTTSTTKFTRTPSSSKLTGTNSSATSNTSPAKSTTATAKLTSATTSTATSTKLANSPTTPSKIPPSMANTSSSPLLAAVKPDVITGPRDSPPQVARRVTPNATSSAARSPANIHRATATPEPPHHPVPHASKSQQSQQPRHPSQPPMQQQATRAHLSYTGGPMSNNSSTSSLNKKRKNSLGVAYGSGSNADPLVIDEGPVQEREYGYDRRRSPQPYYRDSSYPSQVSYSSQDMASSKSTNSSVVNKKAKASVGDYGDYGGPSSSTPGTARGMESTGSFSGYHRAVGSGRGGRVGSVGVGLRDGSGQGQQPSSSMRRSYSPPSMQQQRLPPVYRSQQPDPTMHYRESPDMPPYHHHRQQQHQHEMSGAGREGGRLYSSSSMHSPPTTSSSPGPSSARHPGRAVQHPPSHHQRSPDDHSRHPGSHRSQQQQPPSSHYSHRR
ncbi:hypothetical protein BGZ96_001172 [Linnemannia gamsii]|uniref:Hpc2-related domain-containing protein n=1 Tax=Linnemannia gamsii TaxID=64522 RepID=A0ABQ7JNT8_9FUNG|nr:hypothetical protein BGZ96_001172 [Linnemannia gamsii]